MIRLTIRMPRLVWWLTIMSRRFAIELEKDGEMLRTSSWEHHGRDLTLVFTD